MRSERVLIAVDAHAGGDPMRVLLAGGPALRGGTMAERMAECARSHDWLRRALLLEPRGHANMMGAVLTEPTRPDADYGVFFMHAAGYLPMCGHGTLALVTALARMGSLRGENGGTQVRLDTPAGLVEARVAGSGRDGWAEVVNVPSVAIELDASLKLADGTTLRVDVAYAGNTYIVVDARQLGLEVSAATLPALQRLWKEVREAANRQLKLLHPGTGEPVGPFDLVQFFGSPAHPEAWSRNVVICTGQVSRSPCGTGSCARAALLWARGELGLDAEFVNEGLAGTVFRVRPLREVSVGGRPGIVPLLRGEGFVTGFHQFVVDPADPFGHGFALQDTGLEAVERGGEPSQWPARR